MGSAVKEIGRTPQGTGVAQRDEDKEEIEYRESLRSLHTSSKLESYADFVGKFSQISLNSTRKGFGSEIKLGTFQFFEIPTAVPDLKQYLAQEGVTTQVSWVYNKDIVVGMQNSLSIANFNSTKQTYSEITGNSLIDEPQERSNNSTTTPDAKEFNTITIGSDITDTTFTYLLEIKRP